MARNYKSEYARETGERKAKRAARNRARYSLMKQGRVKKGDGQDVDHKNRNAMDNRPGNLRAMSRAANLARKRK
jgi:hypothetical protein